MAAPVCPHLDSLQVHLERPQTQIPHFDRKTSSSSQVRVVESYMAAKRGFERTARTTVDMIENERLEETVHLIANCARDTYIRSLMKRCSPVVRVEEIDSKA
jgi:hypothetical protein